MSWSELPWKLKVNIEQVSEAADHILVGKLVTHLPILHIYWLHYCADTQSLEFCSIEYLKENIYFFHFQSRHEKDYIMRSALWNFKGHLLVLKEWPPDIGLDKIELSRVQFWVHLHSLPLTIAFPSNIRIIGDHMDTLLEIEPIPFGFACKEVCEN